jgi:surface carbohydrate biosynthesis protein (TIGR04326 family)
MDDYSERKKSLILKNFNKKNNKYEFIESYQSIKILFKTFIIWFKMISIFLKNENQNVKNPFIKYFLKNSIISYSSIKNINLIYLLKKYFEIKKFEKVNYLFENLTWEKGLNKLLKNISEVHAYQHTSVRNWDFRYSPYNIELNLLKDYLPKKIYSNSLSSLQILKKYFYTSKVFRTKKTRYFSEKPIAKNKKKFLKRILIIGDIDMKETIDLKNLLHKNINGKFRLDLKLHPLNRSKKNEIGNVNFITDDLDKIIKNYKFIVCSNSTTSIYEVLQNKKIPFVYHNKNHLNLCPIKRLKNINYISSNDNVKNMILENYNKKFSFKKFKKLYV